MKAFTLALLSSLLLASEVSLARPGVYDLHALAPRNKDKFASTATSTTATALVAAATSSADDCADTGSTTNVAIGGRQNGGGGGAGQGGQGGQGGGAGSGAGTGKGNAGAGGGNAAAAGNANAGAGATGKGGNTGNAAAAGGNAAAKGNGNGGGNANNGGGQAAAAASSSTAAATAAAAAASSSSAAAVAAASSSSVAAAAANTAAAAKGGKGKGANNAASSSAAAAATTAAAAAAASNSAVAVNENGKAGPAVPVLQSNAGTTLDQSIIQDTAANANATAGQAASATSNDNFINFCSGQTITNGLQVKAGSCNPIVMGQIPSTQNMVTTMFTSPKNMDTVKAGQTFTIGLQASGITLGSFTDAQANYYAAPQQLDSSGQIVGHAHVVIQQMKSITDTTLLDPNTFNFFKGLDFADVNGLSTVDVQGGLDAGSYRICTIMSASNHQSVVMPIAQRGAENTCSYFTAA